MESSTLTRLLQESRLPDSYASFRVLVRLDREKALGRRDMAFSHINKIRSPQPMNLPTSPSAPGPLDALQTAAPALQRTASTPPVILQRSPTTRDSSREPLKRWGSQPASRLELRRTASTPTAPVTRSPTASGGARKTFDRRTDQESPARSFQQMSKSEVGLRQARGRAASRSRTPNPDSVPWTRAPSAESERSETESAADATSSKQQRLLVLHAMAKQLFGHLRAGQWEEAEDMLITAGRPLPPAYMQCPGRSSLSSPHTLTAHTGHPPLLVACGSIPL